MLKPQPLDKGSLIKNKENGKTIKFKRKRKISSCRSNDLKRSNSLKILSNKKRLKL